MIRVAVLDDSNEAMSSIFRLLHDEPDIEVVGSASDGQVGLQLVRETRPDVALVEMELPLVDGLKVAETITATLPSIQVIVMSVHNEFPYVRRAMHAGARDYVVKPTELEDLPEKIRQVHSLARVPVATVPEAAPEVGRIITVFGPRGGSGVTTLAVNLALVLRDITKDRVVLVDGSLQFGDVGVFLDLQSQRHIGELARRLDEVDAAFADEMTVSHSSGVKVLLAPPSPETADMVTGECMRRTLIALRERAEFVVMDGGHYLGEPLLAALDCSDQILLVTTPDVPATKNASLMLGVLNALGIDNDRYSLVISHGGHRHALKPADLERSLGARPVATIPYDDNAPIVALNQGRPYYETNPDSTVSRAVKQLARIVARAAVPVEAPSVVEAPKARRRFAFLGGT